MRTKRYELILFVTFFFYFFLVYTYHHFTFLILRANPTFKVLIIFLKIFQILLLIILNLFFTYSYFPWNRTFITNIPLANSAMPNTLSRHFNSFSAYITTVLVISIKTNFWYLVEMFHSWQKMSFWIHFTVITETTTFTV